MIAVSAGALCLVSTAAARFSTIAAVFGGNAQQSTEPQCHLKSELLQPDGAYGYSEVGTDFLGGVFFGRAAGYTRLSTPPVPTAATAGVESESRLQPLVVTSDSLPTGTPVSITVCASLTLDVSVVPTTTPSRSAIRETFTRLTLGDLYKWGVYNGYGETGGDSSGSFLQESETLFTRTFSVTFTGNVGDAIPYGFEFYLYAYNTVAPNEAFPISTASCGYAATMGLQSISDGATLQWNGIPWTGSCEDSRQFLPPVPALPAPSTVAGFVLAGLGASRRPRCPQATRFAADPA